MKAVFVVLACVLAGCGGGQEARIAKLEKEVENLTGVAKALYSTDRDNFDRDMELLRKVGDIELKVNKLERE